MHTGRPHLLVHLGEVLHEQDCNDVADAEGERGHNHANDRAANHAKQDPVPLGAVVAEQAQEARAFDLHHMTGSEEASVCALQGLCL